MINGSFVFFFKRLSIGFTHLQLHYTHIIYLVVDFLSSLRLFKSRGVVHYKSIRLGLTPPPPLAD